MHVLSCTQYSFSGNNKLMNEASVLMHDQIDVEILKKVGTQIFINMCGGGDGGGGGGGDETDVETQIQLDSMQDQLNALLEQQNGGATTGGATTGGATTGGSVTMFQKYKNKAVKQVKARLPEKYKPQAEQITMVLGVGLLVGVLMLLDDSDA